MKPLWIEQLENHDPNAVDLEEVDRAQARKYRKLYEKSGREEHLQKAREFEASADKHKEIKKVYSIK